MVSTQLEFEAGCGKDGLGADEQGDKEESHEQKPQAASSQQERRGGSGRPGKGEQMSRTSGGS